ncbi:MAG: DUF3352 domain-containing protein [Snowella sp.]|nr:DUF3352 domain-containing protein [Snowella sp.]
MKSRSFFLTLALLAVVSFSLAGGGLYWILSGSPLSLLQGGVNLTPTAAAFIPQQSPVMVSLLVNPNRLEAFSQLIAAPDKRKRAHQELKELEQSLLAKTGLNYQKEVKPWLGEEITLAVTSLDYDRSAENGVQPGYLLVVQTKDSELSKEFLQISYSEAAIAGDYDLVFDTYQGANITYKRALKPSLNSNLVASTVVGDYVLFANHPKVLREALSSVQAPDLNLNQAIAYQEALKTIQEPRIGILYANFPALSAWLSHLPLPETPDLSQTLTVALSLKSQGLVAQTALTGVKNFDTPLPLLSEPVGTLAYVPHNSLLTASGTNLAQFWQQIETGLEPDSPLQQVVYRTIESVQTPWKLDLPQDIFNWVEGDYSLALVSDPNGKEPNWIFVAERSPDTEVDTAIAHLDELAKSQGYSVETLSVSGQSVTAWTKLKTAADNNITRLEAQVKGVHLTLDHYEILTTSLEAMSQVLSANADPLVTSAKFQQAIGALPPENHGYFYLDWNGSEAFLEKQFPVLRVLELTVKPLFKNLRSLTITSEGNVNGIRRATAFLNLGVRE